MPISSSRVFHLNVDRDASTGYLKERDVACSFDIRDRAYATLLEAKNACDDCPITDYHCTQNQPGVSIAKQRFWPCKRRGIQRTNTGSCVWYNQTSCDTISITSRGVSGKRRKNYIDYKRKVFGTFLLKYQDAEGNNVYQRTHGGPGYYLSKNSQNNWKVTTDINSNSSVLFNNFCKSSTFTTPLICPTEWKYVTKSRKWAKDPKINVQCMHVRECTLLTSSNCAPGARVERGKAWAWGDEDVLNGKPGYGTVKACHFEGRIGAIVHWDNGNIKKYSVDEMDNLCKLIFI